jgi:transcriptional regulator with XRE-family HTH domain
MIKFSVDKNPVDILEELAAKHKVIRKQARMNQSELASRAGVSLGSLKRFETTGQISLQSLLKLAHVLNCLSDFESIFNPIQNQSHIEKLFSPEIYK